MLLTLLKNFRSRYFQSGYRNVFVITVLAMIVGVLIDYQSSPVITKALLVDIITVFFWILSIVLFFINGKLYKLCFGIATYALVLNILISFLISSKEKELLLYFFRDTIFLVFIITLSAYLIRKHHALIITFLYILFLLLFYFKFGNSILGRNSHVIVFSIIAYAVIVFYFVGVQEKTLKALKESNRQIHSQNEELISQKEEILAQHDILEKHKTLLENRNAEIISGIRFAKNIQEAILPTESHLKKYFTQYFVLSRPKALISGDFFWLKKYKGKLYLAVVDCTGHGVPGAFVSMLANMHLNRAFVEIDTPNPAGIINFISHEISREINNAHSIHAAIGMDIALVALDFAEMKLEYAGAFNPLYLIRNNELMELEATKVIIGSFLKNEVETEMEFSNQTIPIFEKDRIYLFTDGAVDQFGGAFGKKLGYRRFRDILKTTGSVDNLKDQKTALWDAWLTWKQDQMQVDDVMIIGIQV